jgi:integrase
MKGTIKIHIRLDKTLNKGKGKTPIELIYSLQGQRKYYNTGEKVYKEYWNNDNQRAFYIPQREAKKLLPHIDPDLLMLESEINEINDNLSDLIKSIDNHEKDKLRKEEPFSSQIIIDLLKKEIKPNIVKEEPKNFVFDYIDQYIKDNKETRVKGSLSVYKSLSSHLKAYEAQKRTRITFAKIDHAFFQSFQNFLIGRTKTNINDEVSSLLNNTTIAKVLSTLKTFLSYAKLNGIEINSNYQSFRIKRESLEVIALTQDEFESLYTLDLSNNKRLDQVRDVFCFSCVTGLRYSDLKQLRREHIKSDEIDLTVTKTKEKLIIPLTYYSLSILSKYEGLHKPLPVISSQNMNYYIKELCELAGINEEVEIVRYRGVIKEAIVYPKYKLISVHTGRKSFVSLSLEHGMTAEEVMTITGHSDYKSFKRYVKVTEQRKKVVMLKAWEAPKTVLKVV